MSFEGKVAIVTGGGGGFGEGIARGFAEAGAKVAVLDIDLAAAERVAGAIGEGAFAIKADVGSESDIVSAVEAIRKHFGNPAILINNAGITHRKQHILDVDPALFDEIYRVNVKSIFLFTRVVAPIMRDMGGGSIINIGSVSSHAPRPGLAWYTASKAAVSTGSKCLALELAPWKIRVNVLLPVLASTGLTEAFIGAANTPENLEPMMSTIPLGRMCTPRDVANAALFLASDAADFITGVELPVDGGRSI